MDLMTKFTKLFGYSYGCIESMCSGLSLSRTPSISDTLYLELLCPLDISIDSSLIFSPYLESPYFELLFISNKNFGPMQIFLSLFRTFQPLKASLIYSINACQIKRIILKGEKGKIAQEGRE